MKPCIFLLVSGLLLGGCVNPRPMSSTASSSSKFQDQEDLNPSGLESPFPSTISGFGIKNSHFVLTHSGKPQVLRSQAPRTAKDYEDIKRIGISDVIIFKNQRRDEVDSEVESLRKIGISGDRIVSIPFLYRDFPDFKTPCRQTLAALQSVRNVRESQDSSRKLLFHCTVGEDRTGYLAGLIRLLEGERSVKNVFVNEMCRHGYSSGDPNKPAHVSDAIDQELTPLFLKMAFLIQSKRLSWSTATQQSICDNDPVNDPRYAAWRSETSGFFWRCKK